MSPYNACESASKGVYGILASVRLMKEFQLMGTTNWTHFVSLAHPSILNPLDANIWRRPWLHEHEHNCTRLVCCLLTSNKSISKLMSVCFVRLKYERLQK